MLNFAPCYNGIPEGDFDAERAIVLPASNGLPVSDGSYGTVDGGKAVLNLAKAHHEWVTRDLRSYMQRPVVNVRALLDACFNPSNNGGYTVTEMGADGTKLDFDRMWLTLPLLSSLKLTSGTSGTLTDTWPAGTNVPYGSQSGSFSLTINGAGSLQVGTAFGGTVHCRVQFNGVQGDSDTVILGYASGNDVDFWYLLIQAVMYDGGGTAVGASPVAVVCDYDMPNWGYTADWIVQNTSGYTPPYAGTGGTFVTDSFVDQGSGHYMGNDFDLVIPTSAVDARTIKIHVTKCAMTGTHPSEGFYVTYITYLYDSINPAGIQRSLTGSTQLLNPAADVVNYTTQETLHSGAHVTKRLLMGGTHTPADYLLALSKLFGLRWTCDSASKTVTLWTRDAFYCPTGTPQDFYDEAVDLTDRVDRAQDMTLVPYDGLARFFDFTVPNVKAAFAEDYAARRTVPYGTKRIDTETEMSDEVRDVLKGTVLKGTPSVLDRAMYYNDVHDGNGKFKPPVLLDTGCSLTLYDAAGESEDIDVSVPDSTCTVTPINVNYKSYDRLTKPQLMTSDQKPVDGEDILLYYNAWGNTPAAVTDDTSLMVRLIGKPCWDLTTAADLSNKVYLPHFARYRQTGTTIFRHLDPGTPAELDIPGLTVAAGADIYARGWAAYMADRYGEGAKTLRCRVRLQGLPRGWDLLRRLYWYDNTLWVMSAVKNYSLTTDDAAECELVRVRDWQAYADGQDYE